MHCFFYVPIAGLHQQSEEYSIWIPSSSAEEADGVRDKESAYTTMFDV